jgi:hypothetical protein
MEKLYKEADALYLTHQLNDDRLDGIMRVHISDDTMLAGEALSISTYLTVSEPILERHSLFSRVDKSTLYSSQNSEYFRFEDYPQLTYADRSFITFAGVPCAPQSDNDQIVSILKESMQPVIKDMAVLSTFENPQLEYNLLVRCIGVRINHLMRCVHPGHFLSAIMSTGGYYDSLVTALQSICKRYSLLEDEGCPFSVLTQAFLPIRFGGVGLTDYKNIAPLAYLACYGRAFNTLVQLLLKPTLIDLDSFLHLQVIAFPDAVAPAYPKWDEKDLQSQRYLSGLQHQLSFQKLLADTTSEAHRARLLAVSAPRSGSFLHSIPSDDLYMSPTLFSTALCYRLGITTYPFEVGQDCRNCNNQEQPAGFHAAHCSTTLCIWRHNTLQKQLQAFLSSLGIANTSENVLSTRSGGHRPGDVVHFLSSGRHVHCDLGVTNPCSETSVRNGTGKVALLAAETFAKSKKRKYRAFFRQLTSDGHDVEFIPLIVETYGGWHELALKHFNTLMKQHSLNPGALTRGQKELLRGFICRLDVTLQRFNAMMINDAGPRDSYSYSGGSSKHIATQ